MKILFENLKKTGLSEAYLSAAMTGPEIHGHVVRAMIDAPSRKELEKLKDACIFIARNANAAFTKEFGVPILKVDPAEDFILRGTPTPAFVEKMIAPVLAAAIKIFEQDASQTDRANSSLHGFGRIAAAALPFLPRVHDGLVIELGKPRSPEQAR